MALQHAVSAPPIREDNIARLVKIQPEIVPLRPRLNVFALVCYHKIKLFNIFFLVKFLIYRSDMVQYGLIHLPVRYL